MTLPAVKLSLKLLRTAAGALSPAGRRAQLLVLTYHRIMTEPDPLMPGEADVAAFRTQLEVLRTVYEVLALGEATARLRAGTLPARAACITFDDGYGSNARLGLPVLLEYGLPATFFVATGFLGDGRMFNDTIIETTRRLDAHVDLSPIGLGERVLDTAAARRGLMMEVINLVRHMDPQRRAEWTDAYAAQSPEPLPDDLMMTRAEVAGLTAAGMEVGAHTVHHPILTSVEPAAAQREIAESIRELEQITGAPVRSFAYPNGRPVDDYGPEHVRMVADCGIEQAVSTAWGAARRDSDPLQLPRVSSWDRDPLRFAARLARAYVQPAARRA